MAQPVDVRGARAQPMLTAALACLAGALLVALWGTVAPVALPASLPALDWGHAHAVLAMFGFTVPLAAALELHLLGAILGRAPEHAAQRRAALLMAAGAGLAAAGALVPAAAPYVYRAGVIAAAAGAILLGRSLRPLLPRRGQTTANAEQPLTKGDDACYTQLRLAHMFLPAGLVVLAFAGPWWTLAADGWMRAAFLCGVHLLLVGYVLVAGYATAHLAVPRLSGVPAIAAGAIKGELHSTLLGLVGLMAGFLTAPVNARLSAGLTVGLGFFVFVGAFTFMGVLGANIMKNKSRTQQVTREFVYVPWVFAGVCWILIGILMGMLLKAVPPMLEPRMPALRSLHTHVLLLGGFAVLGLGLLTRLLPRARGLEPPTFQAMRWPFYGFNVALGLLAVARLAPDVRWADPAAALLALLALAGWFMTLRHHGLGHVVTR